MVCSMPIKKHYSLKPGVSIEIDGIARRIIADGGYGEYFTHGLGHGLGLEILKSTIIAIVRRLSSGWRCDNSRTGNIHPGFGGMRIEDDYLITESERNGCQGIWNRPAPSLTS